MNNENLRKRVLTFYGLALLCLIASVPLSLLYNPIMTAAAIGIAFFIGAMLSFSLASALARTIVDLYEEKRWGLYRYAGTINPSSFGIVAGIISMVVVAISLTGIVDWEYLGITFPNIFTIIWAITGALALIGGILARPLAKREKKPDYERTDL